MRKIFMAFDDRRDGRITRPQFYKGVDETAAEFRLDFQPRDKQVQREGERGGEGGRETARGGRGGEAGSGLTCACCGVWWCRCWGSSCSPTKPDPEPATRGS